MTPDEMLTLLRAHNIGFSAKEIPYGRQFRLEDGAIANVYDKGTIVWQGKADTASALKVKGLCGATSSGAPTTSPTSPTVVSPSNNKVFIVYGHDIECREQLELLLRRMKL